MTRSTVRAACKGVVGWPSPPVSGIAARHAPRRTPANVATDSLLTAATGADDWLTAPFTHHAAGSARWGTLTSAGSGRALGLPARMRRTLHNGTAWMTGSGSLPSMVSFWNGAPSSPFPYPPEHWFLATGAYCRARAEPSLSADSRCMKFIVIGERLLRTGPRAGAAAPRQVKVIDDASPKVNHTYAGDAYGPSSGRTRAVGGTSVQSGCGKNQSACHRRALPCDRQSPYRRPRLFHARRTHDLKQLARLTGRGPWG